MTKTSIVEFQQNRPSFPWEELLKYNGNWVAFSADGRQVVAYGETLEEMFNNVEAANEDKHEIVIERVQYEPFISSMGAAEFQ